MTFERKIVVGLDDIVAISLQCEKCKTRITFHPDSPIEVPFECECGHAWRSREATGEHPATVMTRAIAKTRSLFAHHPDGFKLLLMFDEPDKNEAS